MARFAASSELSALCCPPSQRFHLTSQTQPKSSTGLYTILRISAASNGRASGAGRGRNTSKRTRKAVTKRKENPWNGGDVSPPPIISRKKTASQGNSSSDKAKRPEESTNCNESGILVTANMIVETERVLQAQEDAVSPAWNTFVSSLSGVWRGIGAAYSPMTAEMEAISLGDNNEMLYDCRVLSTVEQIQGTKNDIIQRKTVWAVGNPLGEHGRGKPKLQKFLPKNDIDDEDDWQYDIGDSDWGLELSDDVTLEKDDMDIHAASATEKRKTTDLERKDLTYDTIMEEDVLELEPGLVYFEDGSYSRGPIALLTADVNDVEHTYKIEQCVVRGGHCRLRVVHTIAINEEEETIQLLRVAVYVEEWMGPTNMKSISDSGGHHLKLFSQCPRLEQRDLEGTWKVFELSATPVFNDVPIEDMSTTRPPFIYLSMETQKRRLLPDMPIQFSDEDILDMRDATVMWLPGGVSAFVDIKDDGLLIIGVGWYSDGINLVMEREYSTDGMLFDVHSKTEVKGGWIGGRM